MIRELRYILAVLIGVSMMVSCTDEPIIQGSGDIPEGYATISAKVSFKPFGSALNGGSRTAGDAIKEIESLYVVLFDASGNHIETFDATQETDYNVKEEPREGVGGSKVEESNEESNKERSYKQVAVLIIADRFALFRFFALHVPTPFCDNLTPLGGGTALCR